MANTLRLDFEWRERLSTEADAHSEDNGRKMAQAVKEYDEIPGGPQRW